MGQPEGELAQHSGSYRQLGGQVPAGAGLFAGGRERGQVRHVRLVWEDVLHVHLGIVPLPAYFFLLLLLSSFHFSASVLRISCLGYVSVVTTTMIVAEEIVDGVTVMIVNSFLAVV